jgi:hypothetical protein
MDKAEITGHKIRVTMKKSSMGPKLRTGEFTLDYNTGIINRPRGSLPAGRQPEHHREAEQPELRVRGQEVGRQAGDAPGPVGGLGPAGQAIIDEIKRRDVAGLYAAEDAAAAKEESA